MKTDPPFRNVWTAATSRRSSPAVSGFRCSSTAPLSVSNVPQLLASRGDEELTDPSVNGGRNDLRDLGGCQTGSRGLPVLGDGIFFGLLENRADDLHGHPMKRLRAGPLGISGNPLLDQTRIGVNLAIDGKEIVHSGEDERGAFIPEEVVETPVDQAEILEEVVFRIIGNPSVSGNHSHTGCAADGAGAETDLLCKLVILQRFGEALGKRFQFYLPHVLPRPLEEPDLLLAEGEDIEASFAAQDRQERFYVKPVGDHDEFVKGRGEAETAKIIRREKERQTVALPSPEQDVARERLGRFQKFLDFLRPQTAGKQFFLSRAQKIPEADLVLLALRAGAEGGHENRDAQPLVFSH